MGEVPLDLWERDLLICSADLRFQVQLASERNIDQAGNCRLDLKLPMCPMFW